MNKDIQNILLKNKNNYILYIILIIGVVLMLFSGHKSDTSLPIAEAYTEQEELSRIISSIDGAGKAEVIVTYYGSETNNIVYDTKTRNGETDRTAVVSDGSAVSVGVSYPRVKGVVIVAEGANDADVRQAITEAVMVALDVPEYKVAVFAGN